MKTVVVGASPNHGRYSYKAVVNLISKGHEVVPLGMRKGFILDQEIIDIREMPSIDGVDTLTIYVSDHNLNGWEDYLLKLKPRRIIFNPGAENSGFSEKARTHGVEIVNDCTLVMLNLGAYA